jgi:hypothetical protein
MMWIYSYEREVLVIIQSIDVVLTLLSSVGPDDDEMIVVDSHDAYNVANLELSNHPLVVGREVSLIYGYIVRTQIESAGGKESHAASIRLLYKYDRFCESVAPSPVK